MGNASTKDGIRSEGAADGVGYAGDVGFLPEEARVKGSMNGSSALHDMISRGQHPSANANVVSRYQQMSGQAGRLSEGHGWSFLDGTQARARIMDSSSPVATSSKSPGVAVLHPSSISSVQRNEESRLQNQIATLFEWKHGGFDVLLEGSWDNWHSRIPLQRAGKDFTLLKFLPVGVYHYKFLVDGKWRHAPDLPCVFDEKGNGINILDVQNFAPENLDGVVDLEAPGSPESSYDSPFPGPEDYSEDPPLLPPQLHHNNELERASHFSFSTPIGPNTTSARPQHVVLNHLFVETRKTASSAVLTLGFTQRVRNKYTTVILHKPVRR